MTTVNNTTINTRLSIIFDAAPRPVVDSSFTEKYTDDYYMSRKYNEADGPRDFTGNTEADVYVDDLVCTNLRCHQEIPAEVHALQWKESTSSGEIEYIDDRENTKITSLPSWVTNVIIRYEAEALYHFERAKSIKLQEKEHIDGGGTYPYEADQNVATTHATTERNNYLSAHGITY